VTRKSDVAHMKSISNAANNQVVRRRIGSKRNANSNAACFAARRLARKEIRDIAGPQTNDAEVSD